MKKKIISILVIVVTILVIIDQVSKALVTNLSSNIGNEFCSIEIVNNTGMALGFNRGNTSNIILTIFVLMVIFSFIKNQIERIDVKTAIAISMILAGGISNLIDRFVRNSVLDFIKIYKFPIFNLADVFVVVGVILVIIFLIQFTKKDIEG